MALSKSTRILILLGIDSAFFLLELIVGYAVHSLALVADAFHMLNDVLSLCVGLWAVKVANQKTSSKVYTYGWQRAETLGALVNGVFLVALCMSIFLEAIQRFVEPQEVSNPKLILVVGCFGLLSNILGLLLFHEHGHSHGEGGHSHGHQDHTDVSHAEEGKNMGPKARGSSTTAAVADERGNVADVLPQITIAGLGSSSGQHENSSNANGALDNEEEARVADTASPVSFRKASSSHRRNSKQSSRSRSRFSSVDDIYIHPASFRNEIIAAGRLEDIESRPGSDEEREGSDAESTITTEHTPLLDANAGRRHSHVNGSAKATKEHDRHDSWHAAHKHSRPAEKSSGGHSHGDLNMKGVFLHVMGDALGNIGVIASALIIWLTNLRGKYYADPAISLIITFIILGSAIPLCKAASRILLQAVPQGVNIDELREDISQLPGIVSCHHLHVWQLSDTKLVASLHVEVGFDIEGEGSARYMELARQIRRCLHEYGIHSSTIQPEFCIDGQVSGSEHNDRQKDSSMRGSRMTSQAPSLGSQTQACLLNCGDECDEGGQCCTSTAVESDAHAGGHKH